MKLNNLTNKFSRSVHKVGFTLKKHSPEILVVAGITGVVTSTVMACKATMKLNDILEEAKTEINQVKDYIETEAFAEKHTEVEGRQALTLSYGKAGLKIAKLYAPSVALGTLSIAAIVASNGIQRKRIGALAAAYTAVDTSFKKYRERVIDRFGKRVDYELKHNVKTQEIEETVVDEKGNETTVKRNVDVITSLDCSEYARIFGPGNDNWVDSPEHRLAFLRGVERFANDKLRTKGFLFLNDVYRDLGIPETKAGQIVGWIYDESRELDGRDGFISFGLYDMDTIQKQMFINGEEEAILLDFNVDGDILNLM